MRISDWSSDVCSSDLLGSLGVTRFTEKSRRAQKSENADRQIDVEHPTPGQIVGEPAAKRRSDDGTKHRTHAPDRHCSAMTFRRVDTEQDRLTHRNQGRTENALQQSAEARKSTRPDSSHTGAYRMPYSACKK